MLINEHCKLDNHNATVHFWVSMSFDSRIRACWEPVLEPLFMTHQILLVRFAMSGEFVISVQLNLELRGNS